MTSIMVGTTRVHGDYFIFIPIVSLVVFMLFLMFPLPSSLAWLMITGLFFFLISKILFPKFLLAIMFVGAYLFTPLTSSALFNLNVQPTQFLSPILFLSLLTSLLFQKNIRHLDFAIYVSIFLFLIAISLSAIFSPKPLRSLVLSTQLWLCLLSFITVVYSIDNLEKFRYAWILIILVGVLEGFFGVFCWVIHFFTGLVIVTYTVVYQNGYGFIPNGTLQETNLFGDFLVPTIILLLVSLRLYNKRFLIVVSILICSLGLLLSQTRGAWLSLIMAGLFCSYNIQHIYKQKLDHKWKLKNLFSIFLFFISMYYILISLGILDTLGSRADTFSALSEQSTFLSRLVIFNIAINDYLNSTIMLGYGSGSFGLRNEIFSEVTDWISNIFVATLYEGGLIALISLLYFFKNIVTRSWKVFKTGKISADKLRLVGLLFAAISIILTGQSNNHSWMPLLWIYFGLLLAGTRVLENKTIH